MTMISNSDLEISIFAVENNICESNNIFLRRKLRIESVRINLALRDITPITDSAVTRQLIVAAATTARYLKITCRTFCYINVRISNFAYNYLICEKDVLFS